MRYKDGEHFKSVSGHEINGVWYPRVTKILEVKSKPALDIFFKEVGSYERAEEIKQQSAKEGTMVHEVVQKIAVGAPVDIPEEVRPAAEAFVEFNIVRGIQMHPEYVERPIWSERHRFSGTVDAIATIDGKFGVLDIKTSTGFYPEYNLQTAAYVMALQEFEVKRALSLPRDIQTRWILRIDQRKKCQKCGAMLREKGGRAKIRTNRASGVEACADEAHEWGESKGEIELREFPYYVKDIRAFTAAKVLWEWENDYWLRNIGYSRY